MNDDDAKGEVVGRIFKAGASVSTASIGPPLLIRTAAHLVALDQHLQVAREISITFARSAS
jgi:hypothetical protein